MGLLENLKTYFTLKQHNEATGPAPEGVCPNCWGRQDWEGEHYAFMKGQKSNPSEETYNSFIQDVARKLDKITINPTTYICETCQVHYGEKP